MQHHIQTLVKHIFRKENLEDVTVKDLEQFTADYPYAAIGQLLLARKLKETGENEPAFSKQADKTALYFNNPLWAHWQLQEHITVKDTTPVTHTSTTPLLDEIVAQPVEARAWSQQEPVVSAVSLAEEAAAVELPVNSTTDLPETTIADIALQEAETATTEQEPEAGYVATAEETEAVIEEPAVFETTEEEVFETTEQAEEAALAIDPPEVTPEPEEEQPVVQEAPVAEEEPVTEEPSVEIPPVEETVVAEEPVVSHITETADTHHTPAVPIAQTVSAETEALFEPYHTIDYFASLGIKLSKDEYVQGKLGNQLKSFTEWLRSMKRVHPNTDGQTLDDTTNQSIVQVAEHSVSGNEVVTEAMAEVWAKQGNHAKAIALYEKLSLLNPVKSAYFASRINQMRAKKPD